VLCDAVVLSAQAPTDDETEDSCYEGHVKTLLGYLTLTVRSKTWSYTLQVMLFYW
jgi:hypothetical protein